MSMRSKVMVAAVAVGITAGAAAIGPIIGSPSGAETPAVHRVPSPDRFPSSPRQPRQPRRGPDDRGRIADVQRAPATEHAAQPDRRRSPKQGRIDWRRSRALGTHQDGRLANGVLLPKEGKHFFTWDWMQDTSPNPRSRRSGTHHLIRTLLSVLADYAAANPQAPRVTVGDLSLRGGGDIKGHVSHQNGLDVDLYYPRRDRRERAPSKVREVDLRLAQDLVDRFVHAGAEFVFVGPGTGLDGPADVVQPLRRHDDHMHVRLPHPDGR